MKPIKTIVAGLGILALVVGGTVYARSEEAPTCDLSVVQVEAIADATKDVALTKYDGEKAKKIMAVLDKQYGGRSFEVDTIIVMGEKGSGREVNVIFAAEGCVTNAVVGISADAVGEVLKQAFEGEGI